jgi:hypothetical protein
MGTNINRIKANILGFDSRSHPAWNPTVSFSDRTKDMPLYFLEFNHHSKDSDTQSVTVTHYAPHRVEMMALATIIDSCGDRPVVCDIGCGNGFIGSLLANEGVTVFGVDDRSYKQPQIDMLYDQSCYRVIKSSLAELPEPFDVAFCAWMSPGINLIPSLAARHPKLIVHLFSPDQQPDGTPTTGTSTAYSPPDGYQAHVGWRSTVPDNYFIPMANLAGLDLSGNTRKNRFVLVHVRDDLSSRVHAALPSGFVAGYNWDLERNFINEVRRDRRLEEWVIRDERIFSDPA